MTNHKARKKLANQKWIQRSVYPCGISQPRLGVVSQTDYAGNFVTCPAATQATNWGWVFARPGTDGSGVNGLTRELFAKTALFGQFGDF